MARRDPVGHSGAGTDRARPYPLLGPGRVLVELDIDDSRFDLVRTPGRALPDTIADKLRELVESGLYPPGRRLHSEAELTGRWRVARSSVRTALQRLEATGILESRHGRGWYVRRTPQPDPAILSGLHEGRYRLGDLFELRISLEGLAASLAAVRASPGEAEDISKLNKQHRRLDLDVVAAVQDRAHRTDRRGPLPNHRASLRPDDEVDIALPDPGLLPQLAMRHRQRSDRLGRHRPLLGHHRELPAPGATDLTADEHMVTEVDLGLPAGQLVRADACHAQHRLQLGPVALPQGGEAQLAGIAQVDHPTGDAHRLTGQRVRVQTGMGVPDRLQAVRARHGDRIGIAAGGQHGRPLGAPHPHLLGQLAVRTGHTVVVAHRLRLSRPGRALPDPARHPGPRRADSAP